jgi:signal peptidase II
MKLLLGLALPVFLLDQITKWLVVTNVPTFVSIKIIPGFLNLVHVHNTGAAFGIMKGNNGFFIVLACVALAVVSFLWRRGFFSDRLTGTAGALLAAGVLGNLVDRLVHGHVVDFIDVILPWYGHWPAFNVADSAICIAAGLFLVSSFTGGRR